MKTTRFFLVYMLIVTPLTLLINYVFAQGVLSTRDIVGDFILSCIIFGIIAWVSRNSGSSVRR